jgi:hypothetical protein
MTYDDVINKLIKNNPVSIINLLYYDYWTPTQMDWNNKREFKKNLKIWTTSFPAKKNNLLSLKVNQIRKFQTKEYLSKKGKILGLHSTLIDKKRKTRYWLMLDLMAKPNPDNSQKIKIYLSSLLYITKIKFGGYILETDHSYHFIGKKFVGQSKFKQFLQNTIKSNGGNGLADTGFCGHALAKNLDICLRIQKIKKGKIFKVISEI